MTTDTTEYERLKSMFSTLLQTSSNFAVLLSTKFLFYPWFSHVLSCSRTFTSLCHMVFYNELAAVGKHKYQSNRVRYNARVKDYNNLLNTKLEYTTTMTPKLI